MASKKYYTTKELIDLVENEDFWSADVFITPPNDGIESEEDSDDDEAPLANVNHLSGRQMQSEACAKINKPDGVVYVEDEVEDNLGDGNVSDDSDDIPLAQLFTQRNQEQTKSISERHWNRVDINPSFPTYTSPKEPHNSDIFSDPVACFESFFDVKICSFLVEMFELYARQKGDHNFTTNVEEIKCFIAILYLSGHLQVPRWRMLWEVDSDTYNPLVANSLRRNRFETLKKYAHCFDNNNLEDNNKFAKLQPLFDMLNETYLSHAPLSEKLCVDESMVPYFGRHGAKQYIKGKPIRYGYKIWSLCEKSGYLIQFDPYQGKQADRKYMDLGLGGSVVMTLLEKLPRDVPFKIYGDRYFSSLKLVTSLQNYGVGYSGTINANRLENCPLRYNLDMKKSPRGTFDFYTDLNSQIAVTLWNDNRPVLIVSSCDPVNPISQVNRWISSEKKKLPVSQPFVIGQYNKFMGGVDRMDQNIHNYRISVRSKKWWWSLFAFCLDSCMHNGWQYYRLQPHCEKIDFLQFRREVVQVYLNKYGTPISTAGRPKSSKPLQNRVHNQIRFDGLNHWIVPAKKQNRCALCHKNSTKMCEKCNINLHDTCFKTFHVSKE